MAAYCPSRHPARFVCNPDRKGNTYQDVLLFALREVALFLSFGFIFETLQSFWSIPSPSFNIYCSLSEAFSFWHLEINGTSHVGWSLYAYTCWCHAGNCTTCRSPICRYYGYLSTSQISCLHKCPPPWVPQCNHLFHCFWLAIWLGELVRSDPVLVAHSGPLGSSWVSVVYPETETFVLVAFSNVKPLSVTPWWFVSFVLVIQLFLLIWCLVPWVAPSFSWPKPISNPSLGPPWDLVQGPPHTRPQCQAPDPNRGSHRLGQRPHRWCREVAQHKIDAGVVRFGVYVKPISTSNPDTLRESKVGLIVAVGASTSPKPATSWTSKDLGWVPETPGLAAWNQSCFFHQAHLGERMAAVDAPKTRITWENGKT